MVLKFDETHKNSKLQPWSTAGGPSCMEPSVPRGGSSFQVRWLKVKKNGIMIV